MLGRLGCLFIQLVLSLTGIENAHYIILIFFYWQIIFSLFFLKKMWSCLLPIMKLLSIVMMMNLKTTWKDKILWRYSAFISKIYCCYHSIKLCRLILKPNSNTRLIVHVQDFVFLPCTKHVYSYIVLQYFKKFPLSFFNFLTINCFNKFCRL